MLSVNKLKFGCAILSKIHDNIQSQKTLNIIEINNIFCIQKQSQTDHTYHDIRQSHRAIHDAHALHESEAFEDTEASNNMNRWTRHMPSQTTSCLLNW